MVEGIAIFGAPALHCFRGGGGGGRVCTREMGTICTFGVFPCYIVFFASKSAIFP